MQMRRPVAVARPIADLGEAPAFVDSLPDFEAVERIQCEMPVQRVEIARVLEDDHGSVIEALVVVAKEVDCAFERGANRSSGIGEQIETKMNGAMLLRRMASAKGRLRVPGSRFVVSSNAYPNVGALHFSPHDLRHRLGFDVLGTGSQQGTAYA